MTKKKQDLTDLFIRDAGLGFENLRRANHRDFIFHVRRGVKTFKDLKKLIEDNNLPIKTAAYLIAKHIEPNSNWLYYQIINNPKQYKWLKAIVRQSKQLGTKRLHVSDWLEDFADATGYEIPKKQHTFENNVWLLAKVIGAERKRDGSFTAARMEKELLSKLKNKNRKKPGGKHGR